MIEGAAKVHGNTRHGYAPRKARVPEYNVWGHMLQRCRNPNCQDYPGWGGRGITVCERWLDFAAFYEDMGPRPSPSHQIDRIDNDGPYAPGNCRWATRKEQNSNRRHPTRAQQCRRGHALTEDNLYSRPDGKRGCRVCRKQNMRDFYARQKGGAHVQ